MRHKLSLVGTLFAALLFSTASNAESTQAFAGVSVAPDSWYTYGGATTALNRDLYKDGLLVRGSLGGGQYDYKTTGVVGGKVDGTGFAFDLMGGYQKYFGMFNSKTASRATIYFGADYQNQNLSPRDPGASVHGSRFGFKTLGELNLKFTDRIVTDLAGSYSTAFNTYWSRVRPGYHVGFGNVGPEFTFLGNKGFDQRRYGAYVGDVAVVKGLKASASVGYSEAVRRGKDGAYGEVSMTYDF